jgi:hypothetical protein
VSGGAEPPHTGDAEGDLTPRSRLRSQNYYPFSHVVVGTDRDGKPIIAPLPEQEQVESA